MWPEPTVRPPGAPSAVDDRSVTPEDFEVCADYDGALELHCKHCGRWHAVGSDLAPMIATVATHRCASSWRSAEYEA